MDQWLCGNLLNFFQLIADKPTDVRVGVSNIDGNFGLGRWFHVAMVHSIIKGHITTGDTFQTAICISDHQGSFTVQ